jgi:putative ABC transport system substrate-binding protein
MHYTPQLAHPRKLMGLLLVFFLLSIRALAADAQSSIPGKGTVAVFYPNVPEPFRSIFTKIIEGVEDRAKGRVKSYAIDSKQLDSNELNGQLKQNDTKVIIALGRSGVKAASTMDRDLPVIVGGILSADENEQKTLTGITLNPDPALLFTRLKSLLVDVKRVHVVYNPKTNESLIRHARESAKGMGLEIVAYEASDLATAGRTYESIFASSDKQRDALWLPNDSTTVEENTILPLILKGSWNSSLPIFSSSLIHVKRGALFALYPNNVELGRNLANTAIAVLSGENRKKGVLPLREVHIAVNIRTAQHIGLEIAPQQQRGFDFVFPEP